MTRVYDRENSKSLLIEITKT